MPIDDLIEPVYVTIEPHDSAAREEDADAREEYHGARSSTSVVLPAQVEWGSQDEQQMHAGGDQPRSEGSITVRVIDMLALNCNIKPKDRIVAIGFDTGLDLYITRRVRFGHWSDIGGPTMVQLFFKDRDPTQGAAS